MLPTHQQPASTGQQGDSANNSRCTATTQSPVGKKLPLGATNLPTIPHHTPTNKQLGPTTICHSQTSQAVPTVKKAETDHLRCKTYSKRHLPTWGAREQAMCKLVKIGTGIVPIPVLVF